jgi:putative DNA primase/helicase
LSSRFVVLTNELPRLTDSSGALVSRFIVFVLTRSFYGSENPRLTDELLTEAPSIFNWALEGLDRLLERGFLESPQAGRDAVQQLEDLSSPISAFIRDRCVLGADQRVQVDELWNAWRAWCIDDNRYPGTKGVFGRDLRSAVPMIRRTRPNIAGDERPYMYEGIGTNSLLVPGHLGRAEKSVGVGPSSPRTRPSYSPQESDQEGHAGEF